VATISRWPHMYVCTYKYVCMYVCSSRAVGYSLSLIVYGVTYVVVILKDLRIFKYIN